MDNRIKYFIVAAEERNLHRAALRLHISQPPLTRQIKALENDLGVQLFIRTKKGVDLTPEGETLLSHARDVRAHIDLAIQQVRRTRDGQLGQIDIGVFGSSMIKTIPEIIRVFSETHPDVKIVLHNIPKYKQIEALHQKRILIAFDRYLPESPDLKIELVSKDKFYVALNRNNPMSNQAAIHPRELKDQPVIGEQDCSVLQAAIPIFRDHGFEPKIVQKATDMISAVVMVSGGFGSAIIPESMKYLQLPNVTYLPLITETGSLIELHCAYREDERSPLLKEMLQIIRTNAGSTK
jgi:DNA-binding transcriptional LysR family regulator